MVGLILAFAFIMLAMFKGRKIKGVYAAKLLDNVVHVVAFGRRHVPFGGASAASNHAQRLIVNQIVE